jgi:hypothetical protein
MPTSIEIAPSNIQHAGYMSMAEGHGASDGHELGRSIYANDVAAGVKHPQTYWRIVNAQALREAEDDGESPEHIATLWQRRRPAGSPPSWGRRFHYWYDPPFKATRIFLPEGTVYWSPNPLADGLLHEGEWMDTEQQRRWFGTGLIFTNKDKALRVAKEWLGLLGDSK